MNKLTRKELLSEIEKYTSIYQEEMKCKSRFLDLLSFVNCFERSLEHGHITASAWVINPEDQTVLLLHHKKLDRWLQPGGHADGEEDVLAVAKKELEEETGLSDYHLLYEGIFDLDIHRIPARKSDSAHEHYDVRFLFTTDQPDQIAKNHESNDLKWIPLNDIERYCESEESLMRMRDKSIILSNNN
ncbi:MAG: NUDIX hydrolase [Reichenbachiella sp.]